LILFENFTFEHNSELGQSIFVYELARFGVYFAVVVRLTDTLSVFFAIFWIIERRQNIH